MNAQRLDKHAADILDRFMRGGTLTRKEECYLNIFNFLEEESMLLRGEKRFLTHINSLDIDVPDYVLTLLKPVFLKKNRGWRTRVHLNLYLNKRGFFERNEKLYRIKK